MINSETIGFRLEDKMDLYLSNNKIGMRATNLKDENDPDGESPAEFFRGIVVNMLGSISLTDEEVVQKAYCDHLDPQRGKP